MACVHTDGGTSFTFDAFTHGANTGYGSTVDNIGENLRSSWKIRLAKTGRSSNNGSGVVTIQKTNSVSVSSTANANTAMTNIDAAILELNTQRAQLGSYSNRLDSTVSNLTNISSNLQAGKGRIEDADFAAETTNLAKTQILQQASTAMLAQANAAKQNVLSLLQG